MKRSRIRLGISELTEYGSIPIDRIALRGMLPGTHFVPDLHYSNTSTFETPPRPTRIQPGRTTGKYTKDMCGKRVGDLLVWGYYGHNPKRKGARSHKWICRCKCGLFTLRTGETLKKNMGGEDKCEHCLHLDRIKAGTFPFSRFGDVETK